MKKILIVLTLVLTLGVGSLVVYADTNKSAMGRWGSHHGDMSVEEMTTWFNERNEFRKERINKALEDGEINESEAKEWEEHFEYMDEFHNKNGYLNSNNSGCGRGPRFGGNHGMMGRNRF